MNLIAVVLLPAALAAPPEPTKPSLPSPLALLSPSPTDALAGTLRGKLVQYMPATLYERNRDWGRTTTVRRFGRTKQKKDGDWTKVRIDALSLPDTLILDLRDLQSPEPGRLTFTTFLSFDSRVHYDNEKWEHGLKLWDSRVQARLRVKVTLNCEVMTRIEPNGTILPDAVFRLRVVKAHLDYDNLVVEHAAGIGGTTAELFGDAGRRLLREVRPGLERELFAKAEAAIVKAGDTKEVRIRLGDILKRKSKRP